ncbi:MAG TPA: pilus assembly protein N-terminal domain-containing protein [Terracidiphilus sp.]|nr:pilus assembly protein N-terminal domain-containing protein [Terracidiphilus sp.]
MLLFACALSMAQAQAPPPQVTRQDATNDLSLVAGRSVLLDCAQPVERVAVGNPLVAEAVAISPSEVMVNGKGVGLTTLIMWERGGNREFFNVTVRANSTDTADRMDSIRRELRTSLPGETLKVSFENGNVFLHGTVKSLSDSDRAVSIASAGGKVVNLLDVELPASKPQILLKCNFASVDRTKIKNLGINFYSTGFGNVLGGVTTGQFSPPIVTPNTTTPSNQLNVFAFLPGLNLGAVLEAMEQKGLVQTLSQPNVLAEDGHQGSILAGGEYPFPVVQGSSGGALPAVTIQFKEYGVRLIFLPRITPQGTIDLQVISEVSSLDFSNAVTISGFQVPAIAERRVKTEVELQKGQSFAIGGLLDNRTTETLSKIPYISNVPILGKFFQSMSKTKTDSELIVVITPEIVQPVPDGTIANPKFTEPFLPPNSSTPMQHPENTGTASTPPPPATIPAEQLIRSMKGQPNLVDTQNSYTTTGYSTTGGGGGDAGGSGTGSQPTTSGPQ